MMDKLPFELILAIGDTLDAISRSRLALTGKRYFEAFGERIRRDAERYRSIIIFDGHDDSDDGLRDRPEITSMRLFRLVLQGDVDPTWVKALLCYQDYNWHAKFPPETLEWTHAKRQDIEQLVADTPWLHRLIVRGCSETIMENVVQGDHELFLMLLVPLLTELRWFAPADYGAERFNRMMTCIAQLYASQSSQPTERDGCLPLTKLRAVTFGAANGEVGWSLSDTVAYASLPSVKRLAFNCSEGDEAPGFNEWTQGILKSRVMEILIYKGCSSREAMQAYVEGIRGPCIIRQAWENFPGSYMTDVSQQYEKWTHCVISGDVDATTGHLKPETRKVEFSFKYPDLQIACNMWQPLGDSLETFIEENELTGDDCPSPRAWEAFTSDPFDWKSLIS